MAALLAVLTMLAGPVAAAGLDPDCVPAVTAAPQATPPCPMHVMAPPAAAPSKAAHAVRHFAFSCAQICAMAGAALVQPQGSGLVASATASAVSYPVRPDTVAPSRAPPGLEHPPKAV